MRSQKAINNQFIKYEELRSECKNEQEWIRDYGYYLLKDPDNAKQWFGLVVGPDDSLYTGSLLLVRINFPDDFPFSPPKIENLLPFPKQFNANLWSVDTVQSLMCSDNQYKAFYGLICMDILNTPHSTFEENRYGEHVEVYDRSKEQYTPIIGINSIMMSMRSNILNGETRLSTITDDQLKYLTLRHLAFGVLNDEYKLDGNPHQVILKEWTENFKFIFNAYKPHYLQTIKDLSNSKEFESETKQLKTIIKLLEEKFTS